jgi:hypothetical protein
LPNGLRGFRGVVLKAAGDDWLREPRKRGREPLDEWLRERCKRGPGLYESSRDLWRDYKEWIERRGGNCLEERIFVTRLATIEGLRPSVQLPRLLHHQDGFRGVALKGLASAEGPVETSEIR